MNVKSILGVAASVSLVHMASAQTVLTEGHVDIGLGYESPRMFDPHVHDEETDTEYAPDEALFYVGANTRESRPGDAAYGFLGVGPGDQYWRLPESEDPGKLYLGFGLEEINPDEPDFAPYSESDPRAATTTAQRWVTISLVGMRGPGAFSIYNFGDDGPLVWMATSDGISSMDKIILLPGSHTHVNYGFSAAGIYEVDFVASTIFDENNNGIYDNGDYMFSGPLATYTFGVEAVPEPGVLTALGAGLLAMSRRRKR